MNANKMLCALMCIQIESTSVHEAQHYKEMNAKREETTY